MNATKTYRGKVLQNITFNGVSFSIGDIVDVVEELDKPFVQIEKFDEENLQYLAMSGVPKELVINLDLLPTTEW